MDINEVLAALTAHHNPDKGWVTVPEVTVSAGWGDKRLWPEHLRSRVAQRLDLFVMGTWASNRYEQIVYEVKTSRSDFLRELRQPAKREVGMALSHRFFFATPPGLCDPGEIPDGCGLVEVVDGRVRVRRRAPRRPDPLLPVPFVASVLRTAASQRPSLSRVI